MKRIVQTFGMLILLATATGCGSITGLPAATNSPALNHPLQNTTSTNIFNNSPTVSTNSAAATAKWMVVNKATKHVVLRLASSLGGEFNFNGYRNGFMTVTVPAGWLVTVNFTNESNIVSESALIVPYQDFKAFLISGPLPQPAFPGATTSNPIQGIPGGKTDSFTFTANTPGQYALMSGVSGHIESGVWAHFVVTNSANEPSISIK